MQTGFVKGDQVELVDLHSGTIIGERVVENFKEGKVNLKNEAGEISEWSLTPNEGWKNTFEGLAGEKCFSERAYICKIRVKMGERLIKS